MRPVIRLKSLACAGIVPPAQAEQIDSQELPGVVNGLAADDFAPRRNSGLAEVVGKDQLIGPKAGPVGKEVVGSLTLGILPDLVRWSPALVLLPEDIVRRAVPGEDPAAVRPPARYGVPAAFLVRPVGVGDGLVKAPRAARFSRFPGSDRASARSWSGTAAWHPRSGLRCQAESSRDSAI